MLDRIVAVCPTVERQDLVRQLVMSMHETADSPPPLLVVASGQDDGTAGWCANQSEQGRNIAVLQSREVLPYAKAVNLGARVALEELPETELILLLNNDLILRPGFWDGLAEMAGFGYEVIGAKLVYPQGHQHEGKLQHYGKWFTLDFYPFHVLRYQPADHPEAMRPRAVPDVTFACVAVERAVWEVLNGLDEGYANGYEDDDFCLRAREQGAQIGVHPGMLAVHLEAQTTGLDHANKRVQEDRFRSIWVDTGRIQHPLGLFMGWRNP